MSFALITIFLSAFGQLPFEQYIYVLLASTISTIISDIVISYVRIKKFFIPHAAMTTGMIIALIVDPGLPWYKIAAIAFTAMAIKNFVRLNNKHIFNPAGSGVFFGGLILNQSVSWWGASFQYLNNLDVRTISLYVILLLPLYVSAFRVIKYYSILSFLITNTLLSLLVTKNISLLPSILLDPTVIFFSSVMLSEPLTSPSKPRTQVFYGITVSVLVSIASFLILPKLTFLPDVLIFSLLIANLIFFKR